MARSKAVESLTRDLIDKVTGFEVDDENFGISIEYATSNFRYHRFLDVDAHKVKRIIKGICDKFMIHCQDEKAATLSRLCDVFLDRPAFERQEFGHTDIHFSVLLFLLRLSESPTNASYEEKVAIQAAPTVEEFNWGAYLLDGEDIVQRFDEESPPVSEDEETSEGAVHMASAASEKPASIATTKPSTIEKNGLTLRYLERWGFSEIGQSKPVGSKLWLHENLMTHYWLGVASKTESSSRSSNLSLDWKSYQSRINLLHASSDKFLLTEYQIVREILWMLTGAEDLFVFEWNGGKFRPNDRIHVCHLTDNALTTFLKHLAHYGNIIHKFGHFIELITNGLPIGSSSETVVSRTYQAFAMALFEFMQSLNSRLIEIEKTVCAQDETVTMSSVRDVLSPIFKDLDVLDLVFTQAIESSGHVTSVSRKALTLLSVLYQTLIDLDRQNLQDTRQESLHWVPSPHFETLALMRKCLLGSASDYLLALCIRVFSISHRVSVRSSASELLMSLLLSIWIKSCRPYIEIIDSWVFKGLLLDTFDEFIVCRNKTVLSSDENFWDQAFSFTCELASPAGNQSQRESSSGEVPVGPLTLPRILVKKGDTAAGFLMPVLREIVLTGKSMELLKSLGRIKDVISASEYKNSLYSKYLESLQYQILSREKQSEKVSPDSQQPDDSVTLFKSPGDTLEDGFASRIDRQLNDLSSNDPLLRFNFKQMFDSRRQSRSKENMEQDDIISWFSVVDVPILVPLQWTLQTCLYSHLTSQYCLVSSKVLSILKDEYRLLDYFAAIRHFYLMDAGGTMYEFYTAIFEKIRLNEPWQDVSFVNTVLQEALQFHHQDDRDRLFLSVDGERSSLHSADTLDNIVLHYKIKRAKYVLDRLRFKDLEMCRSEEPMTNAERESDSRCKSDLVHRLHIFRMRLLHFVNSLHNYIMTRILHSVGIEFQTEIEAAGDLDEVISIHNTYVRRIHERCLLHRKVAFIREMIIRVLGFARTVEGLWSYDNGLIRWQILLEVESEFMRCIQFLSSMIHKVTARGTFPHLESLAFALITCSESIRQERMAL